MNWRTMLVNVVAVAGMASAAWAVDAAGYALIDKTVATFEKMAHGNSSTGDLDTALNEMMALARKAREQKQVSEDFYARYTRVVRLLRLTTLSDPEGILTPTIESEISSFVQDVTGKPSMNIGDLAEAISSELDRLKKSLDGNK